MTDRVIVKGWRGRQEDFRAELRTRLWTDCEVVGLKYDDAFGYGGVVLRFDEVTSDELRRLRYQAEWQRRKDDLAYRERQAEWHAAWRAANREHLRAVNSAWQKEHPESHRARSARQRAKHPHRSAIYMQLMRLAGLL